MADLALAFLWHQHQPYYPDDWSGENPMPWVRLHGVKDYYGMALHLLEYPAMRCTINLVPSLLVQILAYTEQGASDRPLDVSRIAAKDLTQDDSLYLLDHFFMANHERMIRPFPRYHELLLKRDQGRSTGLEALKRFNERDLRDLQTWFNLSWIHPLAIERDPELQRLCDKGKHFSEDDKNLVLDKHLAILKLIIPLHRQLQNSGQVELTTTPFYHPILPLLFDKKLARESVPDAKLPRYTGGYPEDAVVHVARAVELHTKLFGRPPAGMWPAEGSVCQAMIPLLAQHGIRWIATDEEILSHSTQSFAARDGQGRVANPGLLYRSYKIREGVHELGIVFRDHALSDMIGFHCQRSPGDEAARDFVQHLANIRQAVPANEQVLVSVILDGENCWEHYPDGGVPFLRTLYQLCTQIPWIRPVKVGEHLEAQPPRDTIPRLFSGSWIRHNFAIWVGHDEDNDGWDLLHKTREHLRQRATLQLLDADKIRRAWDEIYIAEGSDWFWWYGDDHSSAQDALFDTLFRKHLQNVYLLLGETPPAELSRPISRKGQTERHTLPRSFLDVRIDGREHFFEWLGAGRYACRNERGTMAMVAGGPMRDVHFGFDPHRLFVRIDFDQPARLALLPYDTIRLGFDEPVVGSVQIEHPGRPTQAWHWTGKAGPQPDGVQVAVDRIVEFAVPFALLEALPGKPVHLHVELLENRQSRDRAPHEGSIVFACPSPDFEQIMWDV